MVLSNDVFVTLSIDTLKKQPHIDLDPAYMSL